MKAVKKATDYLLTEPEKAYADYVDMKPLMGTDLNRKIFERSFAYFSKDLQNVKRDWVSAFPSLISRLLVLTPPRPRSPTTASASLSSRQTTSLTTPTSSSPGPSRASPATLLPTRSAWPLIRLMSLSAVVADVASLPRRLLLAKCAQSCGRKMGMY
jgi:hypothetical protein